MSPENYSRQIPVILYYRWITYLVSVTHAFFVAAFQLPRDYFAHFMCLFFYLFIVFILLLLFFVENFGRLASWFPDYQGRLITRGRLAAAFSLMLGALSNLSSDEWGKRFVINKAEAGCMLFCDMVMPLLCVFSCLFRCVSVSL